VCNAALDTMKIPDVASLIFSVLSSLVSSRYDELGAYRELEHECKSIEDAMETVRALLWKWMEISRFRGDVRHICERMSQTLQVAFPPDFSGRHDNQRLLGSVARTCRSEDGVVGIGDTCRALAESWQQHMYDKRPTFWKLQEWSSVRGSSAQLMMRLLTLNRRKT
jgi:hypothetical protein